MKALLRLKEEYNQPIFIRGFLWGALALTIYGLVVSLTSG